METGLIQGLYWEQLGLEAQVLWSRIKASRLKGLDITLRSKDSGFRIKPKVLEEWA